MPPTEAEFQWTPSDHESDREFYDDTTVFQDGGLEIQLRLVRTHFQRHLPILTQRFGQAEGIRVLELGAGSCCLSLLVSQLRFVKEIYCFDISTKRMREALPLAANHISGHRNKIRAVQGDLGEMLPFGEQSFDLILFDAALHHSRSIWRTLTECRRVIRRDGLLVAQREQFLGVLTFPLKLKQLLGTNEVISGVSENAYLRKQYEYYFRACGFHPQFLSVAENVFQKLLLPLNGLVYSKWVILASLR